MNSFIRFRSCLAIVLSLSALLQSAADEPSDFVWSLRPVRAAAPPTVDSAEWLQAGIDSFVVAKLQGKGLCPTHQADRRTLIRRATFDLTGLPPTPQEVESFLADSSPDAFERVVDRLLASPSYGERWGRHWLDAVRYADARDLIQLPAESDFREAWRYRDWVVNAFNRDMPYDQFVTRQIAGDLLQPSDPALIDADALIATGMLAIADFVPGDVDKQQMIADYVNDQIDVVGRAFLGLTLACARCHDHKFDPITTEDYYSLAGIFFSTRLVPGPVKGNTPILRMPLLARAEIAARESQQARDKSRLAELNHDVATLANRQYQSYLERRIDQEASAYLQAAEEFVAQQSAADQTNVEEFAKARELESRPLSRWIEYFVEPRPHPAFATLRDAKDRTERQERLRHLIVKLTEIAAERAANRGSEKEKLNETELYRFRADDRRLQANAMHQVIGWPNRGRSLAMASPVQGASAPARISVNSGGRDREVLHFSGKDLLQVSGSVPAQGSLIVVYRPDPAGGPGQRLVGWEDSSVGQHGLGIMVDASGALQVILRRSGASGDISLPAVADAARSEFQILCITWGAAGVTVHRNGQAAGTNKGIDSVSSDPAITSLKIGGPGSGSSSRFQGDLAELRIYAWQLDDDDRKRLEADLTARWTAPAEIPSIINPEQDLYAELISPLSPFQLDETRREQSLTDEFRQKLAALREELDALKKKVPPSEIPQAVVVQDGGPPGTPHEGFHDAVVYLRGNHLKPGQTVPRGVPKSLAGAEPFVIREGSGRKELAQWLTNPANPLTARVMVNRIWQHHFGTGLVRTSANFGVMGESPSHPELLDYLAQQFISSGYSIKAMHRQVMLSSTYQQSSVQSNDLDDRARHQWQQAMTIDPENRLLWRANRRRLEAEALRDSLLAIAGRLDDRPGGPGFQEASKPRRSLYLMSVRTGARTAEFGPLFDAADCTGIVERRTESIVAPQALFVMNDPFVSEIATSLAGRIERDVPEADQQQRITRLYEVTLGRLPFAEEMEVGLTFLNRAPTDDPGDSTTWRRYCHLILCTNEFLYVD